MSEVLNIDELGSRKEKLKVISLLGQSIIRDTVQVNKDKATEMVDKGVSLYKSVKENISKKWASFKENISKKTADLAISAILIKDNIENGVENSVRAVKEAPQKVGKAFVSSAKVIGNKTLEGAGLIVGGAVLGYNKGAQLVSNAKDGLVNGVAEIGSSVRQGYRDSKASVIHAQRRVRDVKNNTIQGAKDFVLNAQTLMTSAKKGISERWGSFKENISKKTADLAIGAILIKDNIKDGVENSVRAVKEAPQKVGKAFVSSAKVIGNKTLEGAGLIVGGAVLGYNKGAQLVSNAKDGFVNGVAEIGSSVRQGYIDSKASVIHAQRKVRDVKNNVADAFVKGANSIALGGKNLKKQLVDGYGNFSEGVENTFKTMGQDIKNSNLVKDVKKIIDHDKKQFMVGYQMALANGRK